MDDGACYGLPFRPYCPNNGTEKLGTSLLNQACVYESICKIYRKGRKERASDSSF